jgi:hypothetical protein
LEFWLIHSTKRNKMALGYKPQDFPGLTGAIPSFLTSDANPDLAVLRGVFFESQKAAGKTNAEAVGNADYFANQILGGGSDMSAFTETREPTVWQAYYNLYSKNKGAYDAAKSAATASGTAITPTASAGGMKMPSWVRPMIIAALVVAAVYFIYRAMKRKK